MKTPLDYARALMSKAANDLLAAEAILATGEAIDAVCFHAQQAVEKSLKALLALKDIEYPRRHDLGELLSLARKNWPKMDHFEDRVVDLTPYAVLVRYDAEFEPSMQQAKEALKVAHEMFDFIQNIVS
jgi:HEPN domain-containing protein